MTQKQKANHMNIHGIYSAEWPGNCINGNRNNTLLSIISVLTLLIVNIATAQEQDIEVEHRFRLEGEGAPIVVFEAGLGETYRTWRRVTREVSRVTQTFAYNRAGYSGSKSKPQPRDANSIVNELRSLLIALNLNPPYLLVGHSLGGLYMQYYARNFPDEVAGLILVDSTHWDSLNTGKSDIQLARERRVSANFPRSVREEWIARESSQQQVRQSSAMIPMPLTVLTAGQIPRQPSMEHLTLEDIARKQGELAAQVPNSIWRVAEESDHFIQTNQPELVVDSILEMIERIANQ